MITVELSPPAVPNGVIITYSVLVNETVVMIQLYYLYVLCKRKIQSILLVQLTAFSDSIEFNLWISKDIYIKFSMTYTYYDLKFKKCKNI